MGLRGFAFDLIDPIIIKLIKIEYSYWGVESEITRFKNNLQKLF